MNNKKIENELEKNLNSDELKKTILQFIIIIKKKNTDPVIYGNLGLAYLKINKPLLAIKYFKKILSIHEDHIQTKYNLAISYKLLEKYEIYEKLIKQIMQKENYFIISFLDLYESYRDRKLNNECKNLIKKHEQLLPKSLLFFLEVNIFNEIFKNKNEIEYCIKKYEKLLVKYSKIDYNNRDIDEFIKILNFYYPPTNFYLPYFIKDTLGIQKKYFEVINKITNLFGIEKKFNFFKNEKLKICFASSSFHDHTVSKLFKNWILKIDKKKFDVFILDLQSLNDEVFLLLKSSVIETIHLTKGIKENIEKIREKNFDYIIYLDFHMSRSAQILSNFRLAKKQAITWGHPVTSGCAEIDFFLSSELMENLDSQDQYSEKLIKLKNLSIYYEKPHFPKINLDRKKLFNKSFTQVSILQSSFKITPGEDFFYAKILSDNKNIELNFLSSKNKLNDELLKKRIEKKLLNKNDSLRIKFLPRVNRNTFLSYLLESDFLIDSINWSGGNTHLEAIAMNTPVLTIQSNILRKNHTAAILKRINMEKLISSNVDDYLRLIMKLATDKKDLAKIANEIENNKNKLFFDLEAIRSLENFFLDNIS